MVWSNPRLITHDSEMVTNIKMVPLSSPVRTAQIPLNYSLFSAITNLDRLTNVEMLNLDFYY